MYCAQEAAITININIYTTKHNSDIACLETNKLEGLSIFFSLHYAKTGWHLLWLGSGESAWPLLRALLR